MKKIVIILALCSTACFENYSQIFGPLFTCYTVSEGNGEPNELFKYDSISKQWNEIGVTGGSFIEAIAINPINNVLYAVDGGTFGTLDVNTAIFTPIGPVGTATKGDLGPIVLDDIDGLTFDSTNGIMFASHRIENAPETNDILIQIDLLTGTFISNAMEDSEGNAADYAVIPQVFISSFGDDAYNVDDLAFNIESGELLAIHTQNIEGVITQLNPLTAEVIEIVNESLPFDEIEGLTFDYSGQLFGTSGSSNQTPEDNNLFIYFDLDSDEIISLGSIDTTPPFVGDFESCACLGSAFYVYPGDLNHDGFVNNQDVGLSGLFLYEVGPPRTTEHQNIDWYAHPAQDWERQQINNEDIKHFDCNGDGEITNDDRQAVINNMDSIWTTPLTPPPPDTSDYQIVLHPIDEMNNNLIHINVALESINGENLVLQGGHFTIDYGMDNQNIINATMNFSSSPWIGVPNINLVTSVQNFPDRQAIEIGFTRTDGMEAVGGGVIGELILQLDNSTSRVAKESDCMLNLEINTIGMHDSQPNNQPIENRLLQINMCESTCKSNWSINDDTQFQNQYDGSNLIETNGFLIIGDEQQVEYRSNRVCLQSGFKVKAGANFRAGYGSCD